MVTGEGVIEQFSYHRYASVIRSIQSVYGTAEQSLHSCALLVKVLTLGARNKHIRAHLVADGGYTAGGRRDVVGRVCLRRGPRTGG